jgi:GMP synthase (glutamine-hydrolysing)
MMVAMLDAPDREFTSYDVELGVFPGDLDAHDAFLVTGSKYSAYDGLPWIERLLDMLRDLHARQTPLLGICFGHQAVAQALGGEVRANPQGWEVGVRHITWNAEGRRWLNDWKDVDVPDPLHLLQSHQDAVLRPPPGATVLAGSACTAHEILAIGDHVLTVQGHPEFQPATVAELIENRRGVIPADVAEHGARSLEGPHHGVPPRRLIDAFPRRPRA